MVVCAASLNSNGGATSNSISSSACLVHTICVFDCDDNKLPLRYSPC
jgi:hypothetical protein